MVHLDHIGLPYWHLSLSSRSTDAQRMYDESQVAVRAYGIETIITSIEGTAEI